MVRERALLKTEQKIAEEISLDLGVSYDFAKILVTRGIKSVEDAKIFLRPKKEYLQDPLWLKNMSLAKDRIAEAKENGETVVIYGDYDADGISAVTVLYKCLKIYGIDGLYTVIPERKDGYGLTSGVYERVLEYYNPDLIITVDCGIGSKVEVEELKDLGVDVIITDHHELPEELPDCIVVNCHQKGENDDYDYLCGAGVAYKLGRALIGDKADGFLDMVALATIADSMPLTKENRILVSLGLKLFQSGKAQLPLKILSEVCDVKEFTATSLTYSLIPRVNAAGRMGDAYSALALFMSDDPAEIRRLSKKLNDYNQERQSECENLYKEAKEKLEEQGNKSKCIVLSGENWQSGLIGIVAARLAEEYKKPTVLLSGKDVLHGSARSSTDINIYSAINSLKELTTTFGGHSQAAGVGLKEENLEEFKIGIEKYITENYDASAVLSVTEVDMIADKPFSMEFAKELQLLEPCGIENKKPLFAVKCGKLTATPLKYGSSHLSFKTDCINMLWFGGLDYAPLVNSYYEKYVIFEPNVSTYMGVESLKGFARGVELAVEDGELIRAQVLDCALKDFSLKNGDYELIDEDLTKKLIEKSKKEIYGTLFIASDINTLKKFDLDFYDKFLLKPTKSGNVNAVCIGFSGTLPTGYNQVVYLDKPLKVRDFGSAKVYVNGNTYGLQGVTVDRNVLGRIYLKLKGGVFRGSLLSVAIENEFKESISEVLFALYVFKELGLIKHENGALSVNSGVRAELTASSIYNAVKENV